MRKPSRAARMLAVLGGVLAAAAVAYWVAAALLTDTRLGHAGAALLPGVAAAFVGAAVLSYRQPHHYISTACQHDRHSRCRLQCKYCAGFCWCFCHDVDDDDVDLDV